jgi:hypothetical protein
VDVRALAWRGGNEAKLAAHGISRREAEGLIALDQWVGYVHPDYPDQVRAVGPTRAGRFLTIALEPTDDPGVWRPVTGWEATAGEREYHREEYR